MGWLCWYRENEPVKDILVKAWRPYEVLDIAIVNMRTAYIAVDIGDGEVIAGVSLLRYYPKSRQENFCHKAMDESMGPYERHCPERIMKLLTGTPTGYAAKWRADCWKNIENKKKMKAGAIFHLADPIRFSDGVKRSIFCQIPGRARKFRCVSDGMIVKMSQHCLDNVTFED